MELELKSVKTNDARSTLKFSLGRLLSSLQPQKDAEAPRSNATGKRGREHKVNTARATRLGGQQGTDLLNRLLSGCAPQPNPTDVN